MIVPFWEDAAQMQLRRRARARVVQSGDRTLRMSAVAARHPSAGRGRVEALQESERVEFGGGVAKDLVLAFAARAYVSQDTFVETVLELQELFYEFKNESLEQIADDELIATMRSLFDDVPNGDHRAPGRGALRRARPSRARSAGAEDAADLDADNAAANAHTLAAHRYDVSKWVDDEYAPAWEGASWLDE